MPIRTRYLTPFTDFSSLDLADDALPVRAASDFALGEPPSVLRGPDRRRGRRRPLRDSARDRRLRSAGHRNQFRSSIGTGGKAPEPVPEIRPVLWTPDLRSEDSVGVDAGMDHAPVLRPADSVHDLFANRFADLIDFSSNPADCSVRTPFFGCYVNRDRARTSGIEVAANLDLIRNGCA